MEKEIKILSNNVNTNTCNNFYADTLEFPKDIPAFYEEKVFDEPIFDPNVHLALPFKRPDQIWTLQDLGYSSEEISNNCASKLGVTSTFKLLTEEGVSALRDVCLKLYKHHQTHIRTADFVRGGVYRSKFLKDLCLNPEITSFLSELAGSPLSPHSMPLQLGHINFAPKTLNTTIDKWHTDTVPFVFVVLLSDPSKFQGGQFQFFNGVASQAKSIAEQNNNNLPESDTVSPFFPSAGYAIFQQGNKVCHRASALTTISERITMVNAYVSRDIRFPDGCRIADLKGDYDKGYDPQDVLMTEWIRHKAWIIRSKLDFLIKAAPFTNNSDFLKKNLKDVQQELEGAMHDLDDNNEALLHFGN